MQGYRFPSGAMLAGVAREKPGGQQSDQWVKYSTWYCVKGIGQPDDQPGQSAVANISRCLLEMPETEADFWIRDPEDINAWLWCRLYCVSQTVSAPPRCLRPG